jgi:hypothetical protein
VKGPEYAKDSKFENPNKEALPIFIAKIS